MRARNDGFSFTSDWLKKGREVLLLIGLYGAQGFASDWFIRGARFSKQSQKKVNQN